MALVPSSNVKLTENLWKDKIKVIAMKKGYTNRALKEVVSDGSLRGEKKQE